MNQNQQNAVATYTKLVTLVNTACQKGAFNLDDAYILWQSFETLKNFVEQYIVANKQVASDYNKENLSTKLNNILLGLEKGCRSGAYGFDQAVEAKTIHVQMLQYVKEKLDEKPEVEIVA